MSGVLHWLPHQPLLGITASGDAGQAAAAWMQFASDALIRLAFLLVPAVLVYHAWSRGWKRFPRTFQLVVVLSAVCAAIQFADLLLFRSPEMSFASAAARTVAAAVGWIAVLLLLPRLPTVLSMSTPRQLEEEVRARTEDLARVNNDLLREISEREEAQRELRDQREWFRVVLASIGEGVIATDLEKRVAFLNPAAEALTGWRAGDAVGRDFDEVVRLTTDDGRPLSRGPVSRVLDKGRSLGFANHTLLFSASGVERIIEQCAAPIRNSVGEVAGVVLVVRDSTEQKLAEEARATLAAIVATSDDAIMGATLDGTITSWNHAAELQFGWTAEEAVGKSLRIIVPEDRMYEFDYLTYEISHGRHVPTLETQRVRKDGRTIDVSLTVSPVAGPDGSPIGRSVISRDITERKETDRALHRQSEQLQLQARLLNMSYALVTDMDSRIMLWTDGMTRLYGWTGEDAVGRNAHELLQTRFPIPLSQIESQLLDHGYWDGEIRHVRRDGTVRVVVSHWSVHRDAEGKPQYILEVVNDVTQRTQAESALAGERELLRAVLDNIEESVLVCDADCRLTFANRSAVALFDSEERAMVTNGWLQKPHFLTADDGEQMPSPLWRALEGEPFHHVPFVIVTDSGESRSVVGSGQPLRDSSGRVSGAVLAMLDVTERLQLEEQFRQAQKMEALGRLAGGVAHDFNNLLTVINGYGDLLLGNLTPDDPTRHVIAQITRAGDRAAGLTRQLLAFSRQSVLAPRILDLNEVLADMIRLLERVIGEDVQLVTTFQPNLGRIRADQGQMEQVVMNLAVNARDAMPEGGLLTIETGDVDVGPNDPFAPSDAPPGRYVLLKVGDTGVGMSDEVKARIFEPFFTTKEKGKGTGLGLAMVYGSISQMGGYVGLASAPGRGTVFSFYLPRIEEEPQPLAAKGARPVVRRGGESILLVEDEAGVRDLVQRILAMNGYRVHSASNGDEAMELLRGIGDSDLHLVLTDVVMPGGSGAQLARRIGAVRPEVKVLYMSGYTDDAVLRQGVVSDSVHFIQKPFLPSALVQKIREVLDEER